MKLLTTISFALILAACSPRRTETVTTTRDSDTTVSNDSVFRVGDTLDDLTVSVREVIQDTFELTQGKMWLRIFPHSARSDGTMDAGSSDSSAFSHDPSLDDSITIKAGFDTVWVETTDTLIETNTRVERKLVEREEDSWSWWQIALALIASVAAGITLGKLIL